MAEMTLDQAIAYKRAQLERIQAELKLLEQAKVVMADASDVRVIGTVRLPPTGRPFTGSVPVVPIGPHQTSIEFTIETLRAAGTPLHVNQIVAQANAKGLQIKKPTLVSNLVRIAKRPNNPFRRVAPNTYTLSNTYTLATEAHGTNGAGDHRARRQQPHPDLVGATYAFLAAHRGQFFDAGQIADAIGQRPRLPSIRAALLRMKDDKGQRRILNPQRGQYGLEGRSMQ